jgi:hypothetical protein
MKINYGINKVEITIPRKHRKKKILHENHSAEIQRSQATKAGTKTMKRSPPQ